MFLRRKKQEIYIYISLSLICTLLCSFISTYIEKQENTDQTGLTLPSGFKASKIIESIGRPRHLAINSNVEIYVKMQRLVDGKGILFLTDDNGDGSFEVKDRFGNYPGTGITINNGYLYASSDREVFRYKLDNNEQVIDKERPEKIITGLVAGRQHQTKSITLDNENNIYVNIGAYSNSCQEQDRGLNSPGIPGCPLLDSMGGIWKFKAHQLNQSYKEGTRYATGLRNVMGLDWNNQDNSLYVMQHGRDNLNSSWPNLFTEKQSAALPSEVMYKLKEGDDAGWPFIYYDHIQKKKILAPEYGGDGKKEGGKGFLDPIMAFPAHLAPNDLLFYTGDQFPDRYKNGAFIAFHGSWNRSPEPQEGFYVVFVPFENGKPTGKWEIFANGFAGVDKVMSTREAKHRPCGLAQGPDGALYVTDDAKGTIFKISYQ